MKKFILTLLVAVAFVVGSANTSVQAQAPTEAESITLSPVSTRFTINAGERRTGELTVVNDGRADYDFLVYSRPYWVENETYKPVFTKGSVQSDAYQWVRFPQTKFFAKAGQTVKVPYTIDVPATAAPGGHYGVIFAETQPATSTDQGNSVVRKKRVGMIVYASVNGQVVTKGSPLSNTADFWQTRSPLTATATAKNEGNVDYLDKVTFAVKDVFGNVKYTFVKEYPVLPQTTRVIQLEWPQSPWFGLFRVDIEQQLLDQDLKTSHYVLMMPRLLPIVLLVLLFIGGGYALYRHRKKK